MKPKYKSKMRQKQRERARANRVELKKSNKPKTTSAERMRKLRERRKAEISEKTNNIIEQYNRDDFLNIQVFDQETAMGMSNLKSEACKLENFTHNGNAELCEISTLNIKTESPTSVIHNSENKIIADTQFAENLAIIKEEYENNDYVDDKVLICKTIVNVNGNEFKDYGKDDIIYAEDNKFESCNHCDEDYRSYCTKCQMLVHILDKNAFSGTENRAMEEIPKDILEIRQTFGRSGIFTLKVVPAGVKFGPFTGLNTVNCYWKIKAGRFLINEDKLKCLNWMQYINPARNVFEHNLRIFQYDGNVYYHSVRKIENHEELLVYFGEEYEDILNNDIEVTVVPTIKHDFEDAFACTFCCLGFSSKIHLVKHKASCPNEMDGCSSHAEITQCLYCKIYLELPEYLDYHETYCCKKYARNCVLLPTPDDQTTISRKRNRHQRDMYNCSQCKYKTLYKGDLKDHTNKHYNVKVYRCKVCCRRFKRQQNLKLHLTNVHIGSDAARNLKEGGEEKRFKCSMCEYVTHYRGCLMKHIAGHASAKRFKCSQCNYVTVRKTNLNRHFDTHVTVKRFKCSDCLYRTHSKHCLKKHLDTHEQVKRFKCAQCDYVTNRKCNLKRHFDTHRTVKRFRCLKCDYATHSKYSLKKHFYTHETVKRFNCSECEYTTCERRYLKTHSQSHKVAKQFVCSKCDYVTYDKRYLKAHSYTHESEKRFKCSRCDYATHSNYHFKVHAYKHVTDKQFKCSECDYATYQERYLKTHYYKHRTVKRFECSKCEFRTNYKWYLKAHACKSLTESN